jgi:hypothetical protein
MENGVITVAIPTFLSIALCALATVGACRSIKQEIEGKTAEALVLTPTSRERIVLGKALGALEPILLPAVLLLPYYFIAMPSMRGTFAATDILHGGLLRTEAIDPLPDSRWGPPLGSICTDVAFACGALVSDFSWYVFLASLGLCLGVAFRGKLLPSIIVGALVLFFWTVVEAQVSNSVIIKGDAPVQWGWPHYIFGYFRGEYHKFFLRREGAELAIWTSAFWGLCVSLRFMASWFLLRRAARTFDRIATD